MGDDMTVSIDTLKKELSEGALFVTFKKKDGTIREMVGTTNINIIPGEFHPKSITDVKAEKPKDLVIIFDLTKNGWRSFNFTGLISFQTWDWEKQHGN